MQQGALTTLQKHSTQAKACLREKEAERASARQQLHESKLMSLRQETLLDEHTQQLAAAEQKLASVEKALVAAEKHGASQEQSLLARLEEASKQLGILQLENVNHGLYQGPLRFIRVRSRLECQGCAACTAVGFRKLA